MVGVLAGIMVLINLLRVNFDDLSWGENSSSYLGVLSMTLVVIGMLFSNKTEIKE